jgi:hypothetical protein
MQGRALKLDSRPLQVDEFTHAQAMPEGNQDHRAIAQAPAVVLRRLNQPSDFGLGEMLARPVGGVGLAPWCDCPIFCRW